MVPAGRVAVTLPEMAGEPKAWPATTKSKRALPTCQRAAIGPKHELFTCIPPSGTDGAGAPSAAALWPNVALLACSRIPNSAAALPDGCHEPNSLVPSQYLTQHGDGSIEARRQSRRQSDALAAPRASGDSIRLLAMEEDFSSLSQVRAPRQPSGGAAAEPAANGPGRRSTDY